MEVKEVMISKHTHLFETFGYEKKYMERYQYMGI